MRTSISSVYADGREAKAGVASWITFYNNPRLHQVHGDRTPAVWRERMQAAKAVDMVDNALTTCPSVDAPVDAGPTGASRFRARRLSLE